MIEHSVLADSHYRKAVVRDTRVRPKRERVCTECFVDGNDHILGGVHSALPCERCGKKPCAGVIVVKDENV